MTNSLCFPVRSWRARCWLGIAGWAIGASVVIAFTALIYHSPLCGFIFGLGYGLVPLWRIICEPHRVYSVNADSLTIHKPFGETVVPLAHIREARLNAPWYSSFFAKPCPESLVLILDNLSRIRLYPEDSAAFMEALGPIRIDSALSGISSEVTVERRST